MHVIKRKRTSRCTDGAVVNEYTLSHPVNTEFISILRKHGTVRIRNLGSLQMVTFQDSDWLSLKGMAGDPILYVTHQKADSKRAEEYIDTLVGLCMSSDTCS